MKLCTCVMTWMQLVQVVVLALGPGVFAAILFGTVHSISTHFSDPGPSGQQNQHAPFVAGGTGQQLADDGWAVVVHRFGQPQAQLATAATIFYLTAYLVFLRVHRCSATTAFCTWAWAMVTVLNLITISLLVWALILTHDVFRDEFDDFQTEIRGVQLPPARTPAHGPLPATAAVTCPSACGVCPPPGVNSGACCHGNVTCETSSNWSPEQCTPSFGTWCTPQSTAHNATAPAAVPDSARCAFSQAEAAASCGFRCTEDGDCDRVAGERCWHQVGVPEGCAVRFLGTFLMATYVLVVPFSFALIDAPVNGSLRVVELMLKSCIPYVLFMPTFVGYFLAYSLNRLADVSWGNRGSNESPPKGAISMKRWANCIAMTLPVLNVAVATAMSAMRLYRPQFVQTVFLVIMGIAGHTYAIAFVATAVALLKKALACVCCKKNEVHFVVVEGQALVGQLDHTGERKVIGQLDQDGMFVRPQQMSWVQSMSSTARSTWSSLSGGSDAAADVQTQYGLVDDFRL